jgi:putative oxidoreductase
MAVEGESMMSSLGRAGTLVGRIALVTIFFLSGFSKITGWTETSGYMASKGLPLVPVLLALAIAVELGGALSVAAGLQARWGALLLAGYLIPVTLVFHNFWAIPDAERQMQMIQFLKNLSMFGGLIFVASVGPGPLSLDERRKPEELKLRDRQPQPQVPVGP